MKFFRLQALMLAMAIFPAFLVPASAQQEIAPDHYEQVSDMQAGSQTAKAQATHKSASAAHRNGHSRMASKHSGRVNHHRTRVSA